MPAFTFRLPLIPRIWVPFFTTVVFTLFIGGIVSDPSTPDWSGLPLVLLLLASVGTYCHRVLRMSVTTDGDFLVARNLWRTTRIPRREIRGFRYLGSAAGRGAPVIVIVDGAAIGLGAFRGYRTEDSTMFMKELTEKRIEPALEALEAWARTGMPSAAPLS